MQLDALDLSIARALQADARLSFRALARRIGSTTPTVAARVRRLEQLGIVRGYHADVDPAVLAAPRSRGLIDVPCHQCRGPIRGDPVRKALGGQPHVFCCTHCRDTFVERYRERAAKAR